MIARTLKTSIEKRLNKGKAIIILGARQTGKSTLAEAILVKQNEPFLKLNSDDADVREELSDTNSTRLKAIIGKNKIVLIDEAQRIGNIGLCLKIIVDQVKDVQVIATGSSAFELANKVNEPLTGRKYEYMLFPISFGEM